MAIICFMFAKKIEDYFDGVQRICISVIKTA